MTGVRSVAEGVTLTNAHVGNRDVHGAGCSWRRRRRWCSELTVADGRNATFVGRRWSVEVVAGRRTTRRRA